MKNIFLKTGKLIKKALKPKLIMPAAALVFIASCLTYSNIASATTVQSALDEALMNIQQSVNMGFGLIHAIFWPILMLIGSLMDNDLIFGVGAGDKLREIWVVIRNLVNIIFVFILLVIAFYNVTGLGGEGNMALKTILPKFVIALVAVNFSFFACKVILDAANVVTIAVYDIADSVTQDKAEQMKSDMEKYICTNPKKLSCESAAEIPEECKNGANSTVEEGSEDAADGSETASEDCNVIPDNWDYDDAGLLAKAFCCDTTDSENGDTECGSLNLPEGSDEIAPKLNSWGKNFFSKMDQNNIGLVMAINLGSLNRLTEASSDQETPTLKDLTINTLFSVIMYIVFGFAYVALFIVLLARLVVLWLVIALSPIMALTYVVPQIGQYVSELKLGEKFLQHVMAPIAIGLAMSIGYLMTTQIKAGGSGLEVGGLGSIQLCDLTSGDATGKLLSTNISDIQQLMIASITVAVVWLGVFGAADKTIANSITNGIKDTGVKAAKFTASLLKYVPVAPIMTRGKEVERFSFADISGMLNKVYALPEMLSSRKVSTYAAEWMPSVYGQQGAEFDNLMTKFKSGDTREKGEIIKTLVQGKIATDQQANQTIEALKAAGVKGLDNVTGLHQFEDWYKRNRQTLQNQFGVNLEGADFAKGASETEEKTTSETPASDKAKQAATTGTAITVGKVIASGGASYQDGADISDLRGKMLGADGKTLTDKQIKEVLAKNPPKEKFTETEGKVKVTDVTLYTADSATPTAAQQPPASPPPTS